MFNHHPIPRGHTLYLPWLTSDAAAAYSLSTGTLLPSSTDKISTLFFSSVIGSHVSRYPKHHRKFYGAGLRSPRLHLTIRHRGRRGSPQSRGEAPRRAPEDLTLSRRRRSRHVAEHLDPPPRPRAPIRLAPDDVLWLLQRLRTRSPRLDARPVIIDRSPPALLCCFFSFDS